VDKKIRSAVIAALIFIALALLYRLTFIRTVNYEIGGITIPSKYNVLTGSVRPIKDYKGKAITRTVGDRPAQADKIGLSSDEVVSAQVRWAVFEQWVKSRPQYKGWDSDTQIFKKAQDDFLKEMQSSGRKVTIIK
jgi:hypothetical protein